MARDAGGQPALGVGRRSGLDQLEEVVAGQVVWRASILRVARKQELQDAHPRAALQVSRLYRVYDLRWGTPQGRCIVVAAGRRARCGLGAPSRAALPPARARAVGRDL